MSRFTDCLDIVLGHEGGYVNHKNDRGGATNYGITQKVFDDFCKVSGRTTRAVSEITKDEVEAIYSTYWRDSKASYCPEPLDLLMFDSAVNHGSGRAVKLLQRTLGVDEDGIFGRGTIDALHKDVVARGIERVCSDYLDHRGEFYDAIIARDPTQAVFAKGWMNRVDHLRELV